MLEFVAGAISLVLKRRLNELMSEEKRSIERKGQDVCWLLLFKKEKNERSLWHPGNLTACEWKGAPDIGWLVE